MRRRRLGLVAAGIAVGLLATTFSRCTSEQTVLCGSCAGCGVSLECKPPSGDSWKCIDGKCARVPTGLGPLCGNCVREDGEACEQDGTGCPQGTRCNDRCTRCVTP